MEKYFRAELDKTLTFDSNMMPAEVLPTMFTYLEICCKKNNSLRLDVINMIYAGLTLFEKHSDDPLGGDSYG